MPEDAFPRPLATLALTGRQPDRLAQRRDDDAWLAATLADPATRMIDVCPSRVLTGDDGLRWAPTVDVGPEPGQFWILLGRTDDGVHRFALAHPAGAITDDDPTWRRLRDIAGDLDEQDAVCAVAAVALANWHGANPRCPRCGVPTLVAGAGWLRRCPVDDSEHYPRTDAAVIMSVIDDADRLLLGHNPAWPKDRYSTLAGFVEPGETLEDAVRREVAEEVGVTVAEVHYLGSQPWPFPASLMVGCQAHAVSTDITVDPAEISEARWFSRDEFTAAVADGRLLYPPGTSISHRLIERWYGAPLPEQPQGW